MTRWLGVIAALTCGLQACAGPLVLLGAPDATFARGQERMGRIAKCVQQVEASEEEQRLFLQAEGFYQYRFALPRRGAWSYLAQGAAALTDFPAFQSLAGSLDLADFRLRTHDGAVHLWEALLHMYPNSPLRPLTLYRLGWAYRNLGVAGFPQTSAAAFNALANDYAGTPLAGLAAEANAVAWKAKDTATGLSLIPGLGQMYVGEYLNGTVRLSIGLASGAMVVAPLIIGIVRRNELTWKRDWPLLLTGFLGIVVLSIDYTAAYQDATRGVVEFNERQEAKFDDSHPGAPCDTEARDVTSQGRALPSHASTQSLWP